MLEIQNYIRNFWTISDANEILREKLGLHVNRDELVFPDGTTEPVWVYNYNQIKSPKAHPMVIESRALILDKHADVVSMSFLRFFNMGEKPAAKIQVPGARAEKKYDGTLIVVYCYKGQWFCQTRKMAMAQGRVISSSNVTFRNLVETYLKDRLMIEDPYEPFKKEGEEDCCFAFEFVSSLNRVVTPYKEPGLILLAVFDKKNMCELSYDAVNRFAGKYGLRRPAAHLFTSMDKDRLNARLDALIEICDTLEEGYVIVNQDNSRVKLKNPSYLAVARSINAGGQISPRHFAEIVLTGEQDEVIAYFPEYESILKFFHHKQVDLHNELELLWNENKHKDRKDFAAHVSHHPFSGVLFDLYDGKVDFVVDGMGKIKPKNFVKYCASVEMENAFREAVKYRLNEEGGDS